MKRVQIGGNRLGSGNKLSVEMKNYERSTHDLGYIWRSSQAPGTLVPFLCEVALPGDTFDITLNAAALTLPTLGPLFGSFKLQLDVFEAPIRLYHSALRQNTIDIGNRMEEVLLPQIACTNIPPLTINESNFQNPDNVQISSSSILSYLGLRGWGNNSLNATNNRNKNAIPYLAYWEIYKNYYANKQENVGAYLVPAPAGYTDITTIKIGTLSGAPTLPQGGTVPPGLPWIAYEEIVITFTAGLPPTMSQVMFSTSVGDISGDKLATWVFTSTTAIATALAGTPTIYLYGWNYIDPLQVPTVTFFELDSIDNLMTSIMQTAPTSQAVFNQTTAAPYGPPLDAQNSPGSQCGLALKTYQSDLFNNWLNEERWSDITTNTSVSTTGDSFTIDSLILARKVYDLLNRIAISGGTYNDWINAAYAHEPLSICMSPIYHGGLSKEIIFQQVVSLTQNAGNTQPLGTIAGRGHMSAKHKGGGIYIKVTEPSYILGIVSITPRLDYSQGNKWDTGLNTMNDLHKPALDQIGFQDLITEQMAWWNTYSTTAGEWTQVSAGLQPAWINYMTNVNQCRGNFADQLNEMFMTLNRRYQATITGEIADLTTYIDPSHYNFIFAQTNLDAQNFWVQIAIDITARRKMSAKIMPNL
nr:MAG: major capsid protein [Microviridae sp.]